MHNWEWSHYVFSIGSQTEQSCRLRINKSLPWLKFLLLSYLSGSSSFVLLREGIYFGVDMMPSSMN